MKRLSKLLFGNLDRTLGVVSVVLGVLSLVLTIYLWRFPEEVPVLIIVRDILVLFLLFAIIVFLVIRLIFREAVIKVQKEYFSSHFKNFQDVISHYKEGIYQHFQQFTPQNLVNINEREIELFQNISTFIIDGVRQSLKGYFKSQGMDLGEDIAVTVKLIVPSEELIRMGILNEDQKRNVKTQERWVITVFRDTYTYRNHRKERGLNGERIYSIPGNTAFHNIINNKRPYYLNNDLQRESGNYINENPDWGKYYNSTLVVPISYENSQRNQYIYIGLLAVDSLNKKKYSLFNDKECKQALSHAADLLFIFFLILALFNYRSPDA
jgi:hypothetical protein